MIIICIFYCKEISYEKVIRREKNKSKLKEEEEVMIERNPRGRPKMNTKEISINIDTREETPNKEEENYEEVSVRRQNINGKEYLVSERDIVFDNKSYKMIGRLLMGKIIKNI